MIKGSRSNRYCLSAAIIVILVILSTSVAGGSEGARLISSGSSSVSFEIDVPQADILTMEDGSMRVVIRGYGTFSPEGAPELPGRTFLVALPADGRARVEGRVLDAEGLGSFTLSRVPGKRFIRGENDLPLTEFFKAEDPWKGEIRSEIASAGEATFMGRQRVLPVRVSPLIVENGQISLARKISITVIFGQQPGEGIPRSGSSRRLTGPWKDLYGKILVNPGDVERFIKTKDNNFRDISRSPLEAGRRLRLSIPETGVYSVRADSLIEMGMSPALSNTGFALKRYYYDEGEPDLVREILVPMKVIKGSLSAPGIFEADDRLVFHALSVRDDADAGDLDATFTNYNVVWLEEDVAGAIMPEEDLSSGSGVSITTYNASYKGRDDTWYERNIREGSWDFYFSVGPVPGEAVMPFPVYNPSPTGVFSLTVRVTGIKTGVLHQDITVSVRNSSGTHQLGTGQIYRLDDEVLSFSGLQSANLVDGENEIVVTSSESYGFMLNDFEIEYPALFRAHDNMLEFDLKMMLMTQKVLIPGFSSPQAVLLDITDTDNPVSYEIPPGDFQNEGGSWSLSLDILAASESRFVVLGEGGGRHLDRELMSVDNPSSLMAETGPYDVLIIAHEDFLPPVTSELLEYISWREEQGYRVLLADVQDVYDEFNGGLKSCDAIRRYIKYGFENWGVDYVMFVGDGNEDHKQVFYSDLSYSGSPPDYIPPFTFSVDVAGTSYEDEVVASDKYYAYIDELWPTQGYPDVFIGRLPVGRDVELRALLNKIYVFEEVDPSQRWRRRTVLFADDAWSDYPNYRYKPGEEHFEQGMERIAQDIEESLEGGFDVQRLFLSRWTDGAHEIGESGTLVFSEATDSTRTFFTPYLIDRLNEGALFFSFQGHAHRAHLSSESGFSMFSQYRDLNSLTTDKNHIFMGAGCHISQFALMGEKARVTDGPNGDCITEQMLFKSRSGAVGTYASTGFELLDQNEYFFDRLHQFIFQRPPADSIPPEAGGTGAHWVLGEMITEAEIEHIGATYYGYDQTFRYLILGDPLLKVDPGPPLMTVEVDWGDGWVELQSDSLRSRVRSNSCRLRFTARDVLALGDVGFAIDGVDMTSELDVTRLGDQASTFPRGWVAETDYTVDLGDNSLLFSVASPAGGLAGSRELLIGFGMRMFYGGNIEVEPGGEAPPEGEFRLELDVPVYVDEPPLLQFDGLEFTGGLPHVPDPQDSSRWEVEFSGDFVGGPHTFRFIIGEYDIEFPFVVSGSELVVDNFNFPNPFSSGTNICFTLNLPAESGKISIYNVSGILIRSMDIPHEMLGAADYSSPNVVYWDGRDLAGGRVANGNYIVLLEINKQGFKATNQTISVKLE